MVKQFFFEFYNDSLVKEGILVDEHNAIAYRYFFEPHIWNLTFTILYGAEGVGKTHMVSAFAKENDVLFISLESLGKLNIAESKFEKQFYIIEDIEKLQDKQEVSLYNLYNLFKENNKYLILTSNKHINDWDIKLTDLKSRFMDSMLIEIKKPNQDFLKKLIIKLCFDKGMHLSLEKIEYILNRVPRNSTAIIKVVDEIYNKSMEKKVAVTLPFLRKTILPFVEE